MPLDTAKEQARKKDHISTHESTGETDMIRARRTQYQQLVTLRESHKSERWGRFGQ
jgi:hypothetical protein